MKTLLPTSTAGSLPKPTWLAQPETLWSPWKLQDQELLAGKQDALRLSLDEQIRAGSISSATANRPASTSSPPLLNT
jgi:5-methyltetrahydropteroyltriglutamate--homocysteine methyltransferase